ncbi:type II toxin-antitoxin system VapC family toxin [Shinella sp. BYT-45]|uniref:type II toxin-antitoxin system VapC family toxin n=1 Tax=Shinella sp. BYT-45 TaxID=3377377 RepID=UPI003980ADDA
MTSSGWLDQTTRLYLDSNIVIYYIQGEADRQRQVDALLTDALSRNIELIANEIVVCECLYGAYRLGRADVEAAYRSLFFEAGIITVVPADFRLLDTAARIGATKGLKLLDASHYCSAIDFGCESLVTNDAKFVSDETLRVIQLRDCP